MKNAGAEGFGLSIPEPFALQEACMKNLFGITSQYNLSFNSYSKYGILIIEQMAGEMNILDEFDDIFIDISIDKISGNTMRLKNENQKWKDLK